MGTASAKAQTAVLIVGIAAVVFAVARAPVWHNVVEDERAAYQGPSDARKAAQAVEVVAKEVERFKQGQGSGLGGIGGPASMQSPVLAGEGHGMGYELLRKATSSMGLD